MSSLRARTLGDDSEEWLRCLFPGLTNEARKRDEATMRMAQDVRDIARSAARDLFADELERAQAEADAEEASR